MMHMILGLRTLQRYTCTAQAWLSREGMYQGGPFL